MKLQVFLAVLVAVGLAVGGSSLQAETVSYKIYCEFSESGSSLAEGSYLLATFTDTGDGVVTLTIDATHLAGSNPLGDTEHLKALYLNLDPSVDASTLEFTIGGSEVPEDFVSMGLSSLKADGDGYFDVLFDFQTSSVGVLGAGDTISIEISGEGLTAASLTDYLSSSVSGGDANDGYPIAAHIGGIGEGGAGSGWFTVPEPGSMVLVLFGMGGAGFLGWRKRRRS
ncbi:MAG: PEP-CTERM sorting domain-containing protein [Planctomycetes bacterium]|nr:PEP-CTERM sorting domain-containing protein [Planctomycetota bacterium]